MTPTPDKPDPVEALREATSSPVATLSDVERLLLSSGLTLDDVIQTLECRGEHAPEPLSESCLLAAELLRALSPKAVAPPKQSEVERLHSYFSYERRDDHGDESGEARWCHMIDFTDHEGEHEVVGEAASEEWAKRAVAALNATLPGGSTFEQVKGAILDTIVGMRITPDTADDTDRMQAHIFAQAVCGRIGAPLVSKAVEPVAGDAGFAAGIEAAAKVADDAASVAEIHWMSRQSPSADPKGEASHYLWSRDQSRRIAKCIRNLSPTDAAREGEVALTVAREIIAYIDRKDGAPGVANGVLAGRYDCADDVAFATAKIAAALTASPSTDTVLREALATMRAAFRTTESSAGPRDKHYTMTFRFPDLAALDRADDEWRDFFQGETR